MKILRFDARSMRNDALFQFSSDFLELVNRSGGAEALKIKPQFDEWKGHYERVDEALKKIVKSALTQKIFDADKLRDNTYGAIVEINGAYAKHWDPDVRAAAERLKIVFHTYGNISRKPVKEQTSATVNILQELRGKYAPDCAAVKINDWVDTLSAQNDAVQRLTAERYDESAAKTDVVLKEARIEMDAAYRKICEIINVYVILEGEAAYAQFIKTLNVIIGKYAVKQHGKSGKQEVEEVEEVEGEEG